MGSHKEVIYQIVLHPICDDPNYNKSAYHVFMGAKIMAFAELLIFTYDISDFVKNLNELFRFLIKYSSIIEEFPTFTPVIVEAIKYIRTNKILFSEQTNAFQLSRQLMDSVPRLKEIIYTPIDYDSKSSI